MLNNRNVTPKSWLAFELNVLRRLKFKSVALPFTGDATLAANLKRWNIRISSNDLMHWSCTAAVANIENNSEKLDDEQLKVILQDLYVPHFRLNNPALRKWFNETDSWWFDNLRNNIEKLESPTARAIALSIGMAVGDYLLSFDEETIELRQPLSSVFRRLWSSQLDPINNGQNNACSNKTAYAFLAENYSDLMFLRLPRANSLSIKDSLGFLAWREEWIRGNDDFWGEIETQRSGKLGARITSRTQYLKLAEDLLKTASHIPNWTIAHVEDGFITTQDIVETVNKVRKVDTIYTKDFSELAGVKAVMITA